MSDGASAEIFGKIFRHLADNPWDEKNLALAREIWEYFSSHSFDFRMCHMDADRALIALNLAKRIPGQENEGPDGYDDIFYIDDEEFENGRASILCDLCVEAEFFETGTFEDVATLSLDAGWELIGHPKGTTFVCKDCKERAIQECPKKIGGAAVHDWIYYIKEGMYAKKQRHQNLRIKNPPP